MIKIVIYLLIFLSFPAFSYDYKLILPSNIKRHYLGSDYKPDCVSLCAILNVKGLYLGDSYNGMVSALGNKGDVFRLEDGSIFVSYIKDGVSFILREQAGVNRITQITVFSSSQITGSILGLRIGHPKSVIEEMIGSLDFKTTGVNNMTSAIMKGADD
jgi:hypothetical protein